MTTKKKPSRARKPKKALTTAEKAKATPVKTRVIPADQLTKAVPADQITKAKPDTELETAEKGVKKVKTTTIADFRRALAIGLANLDKYEKFGGKDKITIKIMGSDGKESSMTVDYQIKLFKAGDWVKYAQMQKTTEGGKEVTAMSEYAAAVIMGCLDESGERIFSPAYATLLDSPANSVAIMGAAGEILTASGVTGDQDAVEKPD